MVVNHSRGMFDALCSNKNGIHKLTLSAHKFGTVRNTFRG